MRDFSFAVLPEKSISASRTCKHRRENNKDPKGRGGETVSHISEKVKPVVNATRVET